MESSSNSKTWNRLEFVWVGEDLHHDLCSLGGGHFVDHHVGRGEVHEVVVCKEDGHVVGSDAKTSGVGVWVGHGRHQSEFTLCKFLKEGSGHHAVAGGESVTGYHDYKWLATC